jgi:hypothetical protein
MFRASVRPRPVRAESLAYVMRPQATFRHGYPAGRPVTGVQDQSSLRSSIGPPLVSLGDPLKPCCEFWPPAL